MTLNSDYIEKEWKGSRRLFTFHRSLIHSFVGKKNSRKDEILDTSTDK